MMKRVETVFSIDKLMNILSSSDLVIFEGFEMVGKSVRMEQYLKILRDDGQSPLVIRPNYDLIKYDKFLPRDSRYLIGISTLDFIVSNKDSIDNTVVIDRGLPSSLAYAKRSGNFVNEEAVLAYLKLLDSFDNPVIVHMRHSSKESARVIYYKSVKERGPELDIYDLFESFEEYWVSYLQMEKLYEEVYDHLRVTNAQVIIHPLVVSEDD